VIVTVYLEQHKPARSQYRTPRRAKPSGVIVVHTAESVMDTIGPDTGAESVAAFIARRSDPGSYHTLVDSDSRVRLVRFDAEAYGDGTGSNPHACHISAACRTTDWATMSPERRAGFVRQLAIAAADYATWLRREHNVVIPAVRVNRAQSDLRVPGFISHGERDPERRSDPGKDFSWDAFLAAYAAEMKRRAPKPPTRVTQARDLIELAILATENQRPVNRRRIKKLRRALEVLPKR
jgi:hypothetical protein